MSCASLVSSSLDCGTQRSAGVSKLYLLAYKDINASTGSNGNGFDVNSTTDNITKVFISGSAKFVPISIPKNTAALTLGVNKSIENQTAELTSELVFPVNDYTTATRAFVNSLLYQPVVALVKFRNGQFILAGEDGFLELSSITGGSEAAATGKLGFAITLQSTDTVLPRIVDPTIISSITS